MTISSDRSRWERGPFAAQCECLELGVIRSINNFIYCSLASFTVGISMNYREKLSPLPLPLKGCEKHGEYLPLLSSKGEELGALSKELLSLSHAFSHPNDWPPSRKPSQRLCSEASRLLVLLRSGDALFFFRSSRMW